MNGAHDLPVRVVADHAALGRRLVAWLVDALIVAVLMAVLHLVLAILGLLTLGLGWLLYGLLPVVPFAYSWLSLASRHGATPGQRLLDLAFVHHVSGRRPTPLEAFVATLGFWCSLWFPPLLLAALVTRRHRTLHDIVAGLVLVATAPLTGAPRAWNMRAGSV